MTTELYYEICRWLAAEIKGTKWENHVFAVGGCCRDEILGLEIQDLDLAVDLPRGGIDFTRWLQRKRQISGTPVFFFKFGTAKLHLKRWPEEEIEIVQTRSEKYTKKTSRCPEVVSGTIEEDCLRRDFTVNSLYRDISNDRILDLTGRGIHDIKEGIIRTPQDPDVTFDDDPVRILRCVRFATRFGWKIEAGTAEAMRRNIDRLSIVSRERNRSELSKMITGDKPALALTMLKDLGALKYMLPLLGELSGSLSKNPSIPHEEIDTIWSDAMKTLDNLEDNDMALRLAALLADAGRLRTRVRNKRGVVSYPNFETVGANMVRRALRSIKIEPEELEDITFYIRNQNSISLWGPYGELMTDKELRRLQHKAGSKIRFERLLKFINAGSGNSGQTPLTERILQRTAEMEAEGTDLFGREIQAQNLNRFLSNPPRRLVK